MTLTIGISHMLTEGPQVPLAGDEKNESFIKQDLSSNSQGMETQIQMPDFRKRTSREQTQFLSLTVWVSSLSTPRREDPDVLLFSHYAGPS